MAVMPMRDSRGRFVKASVAATIVTPVVEPVESVESVETVDVVETSKMAFHRVLDYVTTGPAEAKCTTLTRRPRVDGVDYDAKKHFDKSETRNVLDMLIPAGTKYGLLTFTASGKIATRKMANLAWFYVRHGWTDIVTGVKYNCIYADVQDKGTMLFVSANSSIKSLRDLHLLCSSDVKLAKRLRRLFAPHSMMLKGTITDTVSVPAGLVYNIQLDEGRAISLLNVNMSGFSPEAVHQFDGMGICNLKGMGSNALTIQGCFGQGKGNYWSMKHMDQYDIYLFGSKTEVSVEGNEVFIGVLSDLEEHELTLDVQTMGNMGLSQAGLASKVGIDNLDRLAKLLFEAEEGPVRDEITPLVHAAEEADSDTSWALVRSATLQVESKALPVLTRRLSNNLFTNAVDTVKGRVKMPRSWSRRAYVSPVPMIFVNDDRIIDLTLNPLGVDECCYPDAHEGWICAGRNPNACGAEAVILWNRHIPELMKFKGAGRFFLGSNAGEILGKLNGGDMDDSVWVFWHPRYVQRVSEKINEYPLLPKIHNKTVVKTSTWTEHNVLLHQGITDQWNFNCFRRDVSAFVQYRPSLGSFINDISLDNCLSGENKKAIELCLNGETYVVPQNFRAPSSEDLLLLTPESFHPYLADYQPTLLGYVELCKVFNTVREDFTCRIAASNSDQVIDYCQMGKGDKQTVSMLFENAAQSRKTLYFPVSTFNMNRVPADRVEAANYILVKTDLCLALQSLSVHLDGILEESRQTEHRIMKPLPSAVRDMYAADEIVTDIVKQLRSWWRAQFAEGRPGVHSKDLYRVISEGEIMTKDILDTEDRVLRTEETHVLGLRDFYSNEFSSSGNILILEPNAQPWLAETRIAIGIEWLSQVYTRTSEPVIGEDGLTQSVGDGVPNFILDDVLSALESAGLTGQVEFMHLKGSIKDDLVKAGLTVKVRAINGHVYQPLTDKRMSSKPNPNLPNGDYQMSPAGVIVVRPSVAELHSDYKSNIAANVAAGDFSDDIVF